MEFFQALVYCSIVLPSPASPSDFPKTLLPTRKAGNTASLQRRFQSKGLRVTHRVPLCEWGVCARVCDGAGEGGEEGPVF